MPAFTVSRTVSARAVGAARPQKAQRAQRLVVRADPKDKYKGDWDGEKEKEDAADMYSWDGKGKSAPKEEIKVDKSKYQGEWSGEKEKVDAKDMYKW
jgi:hypothetical protein